MNRLKNIVLLLSFLVFQLGYGQQCSLSTLADDLVDASEDFKEILNSSSGFDAYRVLSLAEEDKVVRVGKDALTDVSDYLVSSTKSIDDLVDEIKKAGGYTKWNEIKTLSKLESSIIDSFKRRNINGISNEDIDDLILNVQIIDEFLATKNIIGDIFLKRIDELLKNDGFKNPEDLFEVMRDLAKNNKATKDVYLNQLNEFDEGLYWIKEGKEVTISKKFGTKNAPSEIDVLLDPEIGIVECKRVIGGERAVHARIKDIIIKFKSPDPSKIKPSLKKTHSKFIGQLKIDGGGEYRNLDKDNFIRKIKESGVLGDSNYFTSDDLKILKELHITNDSKRFIIYNSDW